MLTALNSLGEKIIARDAKRGNGQYTCPSCGDQVILHKGMVRIHHFAHTPDSSCGYGVGESEFHRKAKQEIYDALCCYPWLECEIEKVLTNSRADVFVHSKTSDRNYAIEVQISQLTMEKIIERTERYNAQRIYTMWLFEWSNDLYSERYRPSEKERWAHELYNGAAYYWRRGEEVSAVRFAQYESWRGDYYDEDGEYHDAYSVTLKKTKTPVVLGTFPITGGFFANKRKARRCDDVVLPQCRILELKRTPTP